MTMLQRPEQLRHTLGQRAGSASDIDCLSRLAHVGRLLTHSGQRLRHQGTIAGGLRKLQGLDQVALCRAVLTTSWVIQPTRRVTQLLPEEVNDRCWRESALAQQGRTSPWRNATADRRT
jgi:hypothetical protein